MPRLCYYPGQGKLRVIKVYPTYISSVVKTSTLIPPLVWLPFPPLHSLPNPTMRPYTSIRLVTQLTRQYSTAATKTNATKANKSRRPWWWYARYGRAKQKKEPKKEQEVDPPKNPSGPSLPGPPRNIVCIGANYAGHIAELGGTRPKEPFFFLKPATSLLLPPSERGRAGVETAPKDAKVLMPTGCDLQYEVELAVIVSKRLDEWKGGLQNLKEVVWGYKVGK